MNLSDLIDPQTLRKLATQQVDSITDEIEDLQIRMRRLEPMMKVLIQTSFESYEQEAELTLAASVSLTTLALIDACIEDFTGKTPPAKRRKKVGKHVN